MINFYHRVFYHLYKLAIKTGEKSAPLTVVVPTIAFLQIANAFCILIILDILGIELLTIFLSNQNMTSYLVVLSIVLAILNYSYFMSKGRDKSITKEYSKKPIEERKRGARITLIYSLVSVVLIFILAPLRMMNV